MTGVVPLAGIAPYTEDFDWYAGMASPGGLRAARDGREARARFAETDEFDPASFTAADWAALAGTWESLGDDAGRAGNAGPDGLIDDDVAFAAPWGFDARRDRGAGAARAGRGGPRRAARARPGAASPASRTPSCGCARTTGTSRSSTPCPAAMDWLLTA